MLKLTWAGWTNNEPMWFINCRIVISDITLNLHLLSIVFCSYFELTYFALSTYLSRPQDTGRHWNIITPILLFLLWFTFALWFSWGRGTFCFLVTRFTILFLFAFSVNIKPFQSSNVTFLEFSINVITGLYIVFVSFHCALIKGAELDTTFIGEKPV